MQSGLMMPAPTVLGSGRLAAGNAAGVDGLVRFVVVAMELAGSDVESSVELAVVTDGFPKKVGVAVAVEVVGLGLELSAEIVTVTDIFYSPATPVAKAMSVAAVAAVKAGARCLVSISQRVSRVGVVQ